MATCLPKPEADRPVVVRIGVPRAELAKLDAVAMRLWPNKPQAARRNALVSAIREWNAKERNR